MVGDGSWGRKKRQRRRLVSSVSHPFRIVTSTSTEHSIRLSGFLAAEVGGSFVEGEHSAVSLSYWSSGGCNTTTRWGSWGAFTVVWGIWVYVGG